MLDTAAPYDDESDIYYINSLRRLVETVERRMPLDPNYTPNFVLPHDYPRKPLHLPQEEPSAAYGRGVLAGIPIAFRAASIALGVAALTIGLVQPVRSNAMPSTETQYVVGDALARLQAEIDQLAHLRTFEVPFEIKGKRKIRAVDLDAARLLAEDIDNAGYAPHGLLETFDPVEVAR